MKKMLPCAAGFRLPESLIDQFAADKPDIAWVEFSSDYCLDDGGRNRAHLESISALYPCSIKDAMLSLGSADLVDFHYLEKMKKACDIFDPVSFVEHIGWSRWHNHYFYESLPLPYTTESFNRLCTNINIIQDRLKRTILLENPARLFDYAENEFTEANFIQALVASTGCGFRLNINNLYISCVNTDANAVNELVQYPLPIVNQLVIGGHAARSVSEDWVVLTNDLDHPVAKPIWQLLKETLCHLKRPVPLLLEWEENLPALQALIKNVNHADDVLMGVLSAREEHHYL